jgi:hypothetical protein
MKYEPFLFTIDGYKGKRLFSIFRMLILLFFLYFIRILTILTAKVNTYYTISYKF